MNAKKTKHGPCHLSPPQEMKLPVVLESLVVWCGLPDVHGLHHLDAFPTQDTTDLPVGFLVFTTNFKMRLSGASRRSRAEPF